MTSAHGWQLSDLHAACKRTGARIRPDHVGANTQPTPPTTPTQPAPTGHTPAGTESCLQGACESWLESRGYARRTPKLIQRHESGRWYIHIHKAARNPIILDLLILDSTTGRYCEVELKTDTGKLTPDQRALVLRGEGIVARSLAEFQRAVESWESSGGRSVQRRGSVS